MRRHHFRCVWAIFVISGACLLAACGGKAEAVRAAEPHLASFSKLRLRALELLELRSDIERKRLLVAAMENPDQPVPENLEPVLAQMKTQRIELTPQDVEQRDAVFWRMLDAAFLDDPAVIQGEISFIESDGAVSVFRHPRESELPAGVKWFGLRQQRTFVGLAKCLNETGSEPCVIVQLRPREYAGSAGLTVAFRRP